MKMTLLNSEEAGSAKGGAPICVAAYDPCIAAFLDPCTARFLQPCKVSFLKPCVGGFGIIDPPYLDR